MSAGHFERLHVGADHEPSSRRHSRVSHLITICTLRSSPCIRAEHGKVLDKTPSRQHGDYPADYAGTRRADNLMGES